MKKKLIIAVSLLSLSFMNPAFSSDLVPEVCTIGDRPVYFPIESVRFIFSCSIEVVPGSEAFIYCGSSPVASGVLSASNYSGATSTEGTALVSFDEPLVLPKGNSYRLVVPAGSIFSSACPSDSNSELSVPFEVPATLGSARPSVSSGSILTGERSLGFYFGTETALAVDDGTITLLREGVPVRSYPCSVSWDWDLGYAGADFGEELKFESGVVYTLQLPPGIVRSLYRSDITNEYAEVSFVGGYTAPVPPLDYVWCSLFEDFRGDVLDVVRFYYDRPVFLSTDPCVRLLEDGYPVLEVTPTLSVESDKWVLSADFSGFSLDPGSCYSIVIPAGTLISESGDIVVNPHTEFPLDRTSSLPDPRISFPTVGFSSGCVVLSGLRPGSDVRVFSPGGVLLFHQRVSSARVSVPVSSGPLIVCVDGVTRKISVP